MLNPAYMYIVASIGKESYEKLKYDHTYYHITFASISGKVVYSKIKIDCSYI